MSQTTHTPVVRRQTVSCDTAICQATIPEAQILRRYRVKNVRERRMVMITYCEHCNTLRKYTHAWCNGEWLPISSVVVTNPTARAALMRQINKSAGDVDASAA